MSKKTLGVENEEVVSEVKTCETKRVMINGEDKIEITFSDGTIIYGSL